MRSGWVSASTSAKLARPSRRSAIRARQGHGADGGGPARHRQWRGADQVGRHDGRACGRCASAAARRRVRQIGRNIAPAGERPFHGSGRGAPTRSGSWLAYCPPSRRSCPFSTKGRPAMTPTTSPACAARRWFRRPCSSRKGAGEGIVGNDTPAGFVGDHHDGGGTGGKGGKQAVGSRARSWSASMWLVSQSVAQSTRTASLPAQRRQGRGEVKRGLDRGPGWAAVCAVAGDAVAHLVIPCLGRGDVAARAARGRDKRRSARRICPTAPPPMTRLRAGSEKGGDSDPVTRLPRKTEAKGGTAAELDLEVSHGT
jgi:hypothetical protein